MYLFSLLFWIVLLIPGYAVLRRWDRSLLEAGILPAISLSFLASLVVASPVSILGFLVGMPVWCLSAFLVAFVLWGAYDLFVRAKAADELVTLLKGFFVVEIALLALVLWADARIGSKLGADALIHMTRVRQFLDHGLTNVDPFVAGDHFYGIYHTNLFHALLASCSQLTGVDHMGVWYAFLPLANLLIAGSIAFLAWRIFPRVWIGWLAALFFLADQGPIDFMTYPNKLSPFFLIPIVVAFLVEALQDRPTRKQAIQLGAAAVVIAQFHGMYAVFTAVLVGPTIAVFAAWRLLVRRENPMPWVALGLAVACALPWPLVSKLDEIKTERETLLMKIERDADPNSIEATGSARSAIVAKDEDDDKFYTIEEVAGFKVDWIMKDPLRGWGGGRGFFGKPGYRYQLLAIGLLAGLLTVRRRFVLLACCVLVSCAAFLYTAPLCTLLLWVVDAKWIVLRLETAGFPVLFPALAVGAVAWHIDRLIESPVKVAFALVLGLYAMIAAPGLTVAFLVTQLVLIGLWLLLFWLPFKRLRGAPREWPHPWTRWTASLVAGLILPFAFDYSGQADVGYAPIVIGWKGEGYNWNNFWTFANRPKQELDAEYQALRRNRVFLDKCLPRGETILSRDTRAMEAVMLHDCHILAPLRSSSGVPGLSYLRKVNRMMINERLDWESRRRLLKEHGIRFYLLQGRPRWLEGHIKFRDGRKQLFEDPNQRDWRLVELELDA